MTHSVDHGQRRRVTLPEVDLDRGGSGSYKSEQHLHQPLRRQDCGIGHAVRVRKPLVLVLLLMAVSGATGAVLGAWLDDDPRPIGAVQSARDLAAEIGCTDLREQTQAIISGYGPAADEPRPQLAEAIRCEKDGVEDGYNVLFFMETTDRNEWLDLTLPKGSAYLEGVNWLIAAEEQELKELQSNLGGTLVLGRAACRSCYAGMD